MNEREILTDMQMEMVESSQTDYSDLRAFFINCTLKRSPEVTEEAMMKNMQAMQGGG